MTLLPILPFAHDLLKKAIRPGGQVIDGTCGNGNDTVLLAELVGENGQVFAFDIQSQAIEATRQKLTEQNLLAPVTLIQDSHDQISEHVKTSIQAAIFNLGYLPGGDKQITTRASSTIKSVEQILALLEPNGILIIVVYHGHPEGKIEKEQLEAFTTELPQQEFHVLQYRYVNQKNNPPYVLVIEKRK